MQGQQLRMTVHKSSVGRRRSKAGSGFGRRKVQTGWKEGLVRDLNRERLPVVQLALFDPLQEVLARQLRMHLRQVGVGPFRRVRDELLEALQRPLYRDGRVQELDGSCTDARGDKQNGATMKSAVRTDGTNHTPGSQAAATTHAQ